MTKHTTNGIFRTSAHRGGDDDEQGSVINQDGTGTGTTTTTTTTGGG